MQNFVRALWGNCLERRSSDRNLHIRISETIEANEIFELLALVPSRFDENRARYDFSNSAYQMKIARFSPKLTSENKILVLIGGESAPELQMRVVEDFDAEF